MGVGRWDLGLTIWFEFSSFHFLSLASVIVCEVVKCIMCRADLCGNRGVSRESRPLIVTMLPSIPPILWGLWFQAHKARRRLENFLCDTNTYHIHVGSLCNRSPWDADVTRIFTMWVNCWCVALLQVVSAIKFTNEETVEKKIWKAEILDKSLTRHCSSPTGE